jgi:leucyl-tRNA synthetase
VLVMFIYPSGDMHLGHARNYTIGDVICRFRKMQGLDVLHPFGWDAFGLPAENAAIAHNVPPWVWTFDSIDLCKKNLNLLGIAYDWDREVTTCKPEYYRWNQWLFLRFWERGLVYRKEAYVNWCPTCRTVLANEQVIDGKCYRSACATPVEKKKLTQWFFRITRYAQELLDGVDTLTGWPESVRTMQRNWIGRSEGVEVTFKLAHSDEELPVFTTRTDTLYGVTFMALAPDAALAETIARGTEYEQPVREFCARVLLRPEIERVAQTGEKEGVFTGRYAVNPLTGEKVPIYVADFVLASYGTGMIMAVPAHDQRDFEFARKYGIPVRVVIRNGQSPTTDGQALAEAYVVEGVMVNSGQFDGTPSGEGIGRVTEHLVKQGLGRRVVNYRLKDWLISRQRYWGTPIPMVHCDACGIVGVPDEELPVVLPDGVKDYKPKGKSVLAGVDGFYRTNCPKCGGPAHRDPDTMDTFVDSSWYHLRYADAQNGKLPFARGEADKWLPIDEYIGGIEHATGHLIFFRFFTRVLADMGMVAVREPAKVLHTQGMVSLAGRTMSSSKQHGVWVGPFVGEYGADTARLAVLFAAPPEKGMEWTEDLVTGITRFLGRLWRLYEEHGGTVSFETPDPDKLTGAERGLYIRVNQTQHKVISDSEAIRFNTAIAAQMELLNDLYAFPDKKTRVFGFALGRLVFLLAPFAPHVAEELYHRARPGADSVFAAGFPDYDRRFLAFDVMEIPVQVNGKLRDRVAVPRSSGDDEVKRRAMAAPGVQQFVAGRAVLKVIYVKERLVNVVVKEGKA